VPGMVTQLYDACHDQDWQRAEALEAEVWSLCKVLDSRDYLAPYNAIARNKALVNACGWLRVGRCRPPLITVPDELVARLRADLQPDFEKWLASAERFATA
jgi:dihydrodipicolinate synthase/N-acetylneuraminate lyase